MLSGCLDDQVSYDAYNSNKAKFMGALTSTFLKVFEEANHNINISNMLTNIYQKLDSKDYDQRPVLSSNQTVDVNGKFIDLEPASPTVEIVPIKPPQPEPPKPPVNEPLPTTEIPDDDGLCSNCVIA